MLDTNALSAWADADGALLRVLPKDRLWHLPVVALGEFLFGIRRSRERPKLERWIEEVKATCALVAVDEDTAHHYASIREDLRTAATPIPENDIWIAALCRQHHLAVASRDGHFDRVRGLKRVAW
ncbi:MAG: type II toxin-antitoxin system VapC family toxin [Verrucomicrobiae bacterium]|nr:type II toxin-antitoxin system VapC family toxin [Verrucomicrobiae bacterium]